MVGYVVRSALELDVFAYGKGWGWGWGVGFGWLVVRCSHEYTEYQKGNELRY